MRVTGMSGSSIVDDVRFPLIQEESDEDMGFGLFD